MSKWILALGVAALQVLSVTAEAQTPPTAEEKTAARAERRMQGIEATRQFQPGEGNPIPDARPKASITIRVSTGPPPSPPSSCEKGSPSRPMSA